tara:strand:+ start:110 stop:877 length:768 start_codon:yes stop_codon:yes gene_type:complete
MILTLPVSHLINEENYVKIPGVKALEYKKEQTVICYPGPLLFHSGKGVTDHDFVDYFNTLLPYLKSHKFSHFSFDIGPAAERCKTKDYYYVAESEVLTAGEITQISAERLRYVKKFFDGIVALENLNYFPTSAYDHVCDPDFISKIVRENDVYLILDIAHAMISAHNLNFSPEDYFSRLPLDRVKEIHFSAHGMLDGKWRDLHNRPNNETYELLEMLAGHVNKDTYLIIEFYKDFYQLIEIYKEVNDWLNSKAMA